MEIVDGIEPVCQDLSGLEQVPQVCKAVMAACIACAASFDGIGIVTIFGVVDIDGAVPCEQLPVAGIAGRHDAIKHISTQGDKLHQVGRRANPHDITW